MFWETVHDGGVSVELDESEAHVVSEDNNVCQTVQYAC